MAGRTDLPVMSVYMQNVLLNHVLRSASVSGSSLWLALYDYDYSYLNPIEVQATDYNRLNVSGLWTVSSTGSAVNTNVIIYPSATEDWGDITHVGLVNDETAGSILFFTPLAASATIHEGDSLAFRPAYLSIDMTNDGLANGMAMISNHTGSKILNHYLNNIIYYTPGSSIFLALYITAPETDDTGGVELSGSVGYSRIQVPTSACWVVPTSGSTHNALPVIFTNYASNDWGTIRCLGIRNHPTSGSLLFYGLLNPAITLLNPDGFMFDVPDIKIRAYLSQGGIT